MKSKCETLAREGAIFEENKKKIRSKSLKEQCPFKPDIGEFNRQLANTGESRKEFLNRMINSKKVQMEAFEEKCNQMKFIQENYDSKSGQPLYVPKIGEYDNYSHLDRKLQGYKSVFDALHEEARILKDKKKHLLKNKHKENQQKTQEYKERSLCHNSKKILYNLYKKKLNKLFEMLDNDYDGYISAQRINITELSNELLDVITPLLLKLEEHSLKLNFDQFVEIVLEFSKCLSLPDKEILLGQERELFKNLPEEPTFTPTLTENTRAIMEYAKDLHRKPNLWEDHRIRATGDKENRELEHCTFQPQTIDYQPEKLKFGVKSKMGVRDVLIETLGDAIPQNRASS